MAGENNNNNLCPLCVRKVPYNARKLRCDSCLMYIHQNCSGLLKTDLDDILCYKRCWSCLNCNESNFPFNSISDDDLFLASVCSSENCNDFISRSHADKLFVPFELNDNDYVHQDIDPDPDSYFYHENQLISNLNSKYYLEREFSKYLSPVLGKEQDCVSFVHLNIRSAPKNLMNFESYLQSLNFSFDCIGLTETWFNASSSEVFGIEGYNKIDKCRLNRPGGGVSILLKDDIQYKERSDLSIFNDNIECIFVEATLLKKIIIGVIYRPPNKCIDDFNEQLKNILDQINIGEMPCYLLGDTNINVINHITHKPTENYLELMYSKGLIPVINRPTRVTNHSATLIDHIFTNTYDATNFFQGILVTDITDHYPIFHVAHFDHDSKPKDEYFYKRNMSLNNYSSFYEDISKTDWSEVYNLNNCQRSFSLFYDKMKYQFDKSFPLKRIRKGYKNKLPWLTDDLRNSINHKNKLYVKSKKHDTAFNKIQYHEYKSSLQQQLKNTEKQYYNDLIEKNKTNMRKTWEVIKSVIGKKKQSLKYSEFIVDGKTTNDPNVIANKFNEYFAHIGPNLAKNIPGNSTSFSQYLKKSYMESFFINNIKQNEIKDIVMSLKDGAPGIDGIPASVLKHSIDQIAMPLSHICQLSLNEGCFPSELKIAKIIPLYKANDPSLFNNYRPISLLSVFSKILEKIMYDRLYNYLMDMKILYEYQFGFQKNKSTYMALISLTDKLLAALDNGDICVGLFIDFRKAFDTVNHCILLDKLYHYGIRGIAHDWFFSYLQNRKQCVEFDNVTSTVIDMKCGVPQGSNLGPLLFLIYIYDLAYVSPELFAVLFADDSNFFCTGSDLSNVIDVVNRELCLIVDWLNCNKMSLNIEKTHFMIFKPKRKKIDSCQDIIINGCKINEVKCTKFLGVIIDCDLLWKNHIDHICSKIAKNIGIMTKARSIFRSDTLVSLYYSFIYPYLSYCIHVWGSTFHTYVNKIVVLQKRVIRLIAGVSRRTHSKPFFSSLGILEIEQVYFYNVGLFMYKQHHGWLPQIFDKLKRNFEIHDHYTRQSNLLHPPKPQTEYRKRSFNYQSIQIWNSIHKESFVNLKIGTFKKHLKRYLLHQE